MAESLSHKFGQIIGDLLELALEPHLKKFAKKHKLYLDKKGERNCRSGKKVSWIDGNNNKHDLDYVLERGGTDNKVGVPVAFIESAWRRYTKHSRNKAQEIQSAILPLAEKYQSSSPFIGVILAGVFTSGALSQLKSNGFTVLYFPYHSVIKAFNWFGIDASFDEETAESDFRTKIENWVKFPDKREVAKVLLKLNRKEVDDFFDVLNNSVSRFIESVLILPLFGIESIANSVNEAIILLEKYSEIQDNLPLSRYEVIIKFNNGDKIDANFKDKRDCVRFLKNYK